jgi:hypothetical protein
MIEDDSSVKEDATKTNRRVLPLRALRECITLCREQLLHSIPTVQEHRMVIV